MCNEFLVPNYFESELYFEKNAKNILPVIVVQNIHRNLMKFHSNLNLSKVLLWINVPFIYPLIMFISRLPSFQIPISYSLLYAFFSSLTPDRLISVACWPCLVSCSPFLLLARSGPFMGQALWPPAYGLWPVLLEEGDIHCSPPSISPMSTLVVLFVSQLDADTKCILLLVGIKLESLTHHFTLLFFS